MSEASRIRPMGHSDLAQVLAWRNHLQVRQHMLTQHEISIQEHCIWFAQASRDATKRLLIVESHQGHALGFVQFSNVAPAGEAIWGFYVRPLAPPGIGMQLGQTALDHAFGPLQLQKVSGQALGNNLRSQAFHLRLGFKQEGVQSLVQPGATTVQTLVCFGLRAEDWPQSRASNLAEKGKHDFH